MWAGLLKAQNVLHVVKPGRFTIGPLGGTKGAVGKGFAAGALCELQSFTGTGIHDGVITHHIASSQAVHADLLIGARSTMPSRP